MLAFYNECTNGEKIELGKCSSPTRRSCQSLWINRFNIIYLAYTFFSDTFELYGVDGTIAISEQNISWSGDKGQRFKRGPNSSSDQWIDPENEHFIVWMRTSGLPNFRKPWGWIYQDIPVGSYVMRVHNSYNSSQWNSNRYFYLSTDSFLGGKNYFIPGIFMLLALLNLIAIIFFCRRDRKLK